MEFESIARLLGDKQTGVILLDPECKVCRASKAACSLLEVDCDKLVNRPLEKAAPRLFVKGGLRGDRFRYSFQKYLLLAQYTDLSEIEKGWRLLTISDVSGEVVSGMYRQALNCLGESVILCDEDSDIIMVNDSATKRESLLTDNLSGTNIRELYDVSNQIMNVPETIATGMPRLDIRQQYTTKYGNKFDSVTNTYPLYEENRVIGAVSLMEDFSKVDELSKKIMDLQAKMTDRGKARSRSVQNLSAQYTFDSIICNSECMRKVIQKCKQAAKSDSGIMIYGETGTGKELFAHSIHNASRRAGRPFVAINCAALPENLLESLLFGTAKGAYTGAEDREGLFEQAHTGTLLLDELNSTSLSLQSKLLRVLQDGVICRLGSSVNTTVDVRVISNINIPPSEAVKKNILRQDLFYRLGVVNIRIPPLCERKEDIALLAKAFILSYNTKLFRNITNISADTLAAFMAYHWPGNVRELQHAIEHAINVLPDDHVIITPQFLPEHIAEEVSEKQSEGSLLFEAAAGSTWNEIIDGFEKQMLQKSLRENEMNVTRTAKSLGISRQNLQYRMAKHGMNKSSGG